MRVFGEGQKGTTEENMLKIAIVENEREDADLLETFIRRYEKETGVTAEVSRFEDGELFLLNYKTHYDVVFLDIKLVGIDGLETARRLRVIDQEIVIVFVTNMAQYAIRGYEVDACDFAIKPLTYGDFYLKMRKASRHIRRDAEDIIAFKTTSSVVKISASGIYYIEVMKHDIIYHTAGGEIRTHGTMREVEERLRPYSFFRVHHSYLVNLRHVWSVKGDIIVVSGTEIKVSRAKKADFLQAFAKYAGGGIGYDASCSI